MFVSQYLGRIFSTNAVLVEKTLPPLSISLDFPSLESHFYHTPLPKAVEFQYPRRIIANNSTPETPLAPLL